MYVYLSDIGIYAEIWSKAIHKQYTFIYGRYPRAESQKCATDIR